MSKNVPPFSLVFVTFALILQIFTCANAQAMEASIKITADKPGSVDVRINFGPKSERNTSRDVWFLDEFAGTTGLADRRSTVYIYDHQGYLVKRKRFLPGERVIGDDIGGLVYSVNVAPLVSPSAAAHLSWLQTHGGLLMLDDLLPQSAGKSATVRLEMPAGWTILTTEMESQRNTFAVSNTEKAVFYVGDALRDQQIKTANSSLKLSLKGEWLFSDAEAAAMVESIFVEYERVFGRLPGSPTRIWIGKFPLPNGIGNWEADTRGRSVTIVSSDMPFKSQSLQRLHEQLRHELFHLWLPNGVNLSGNYDWFYEGFALYQSLKLGVASGRIRFDDFLDTLSRAYNIDTSKSQRISLVDAAKRRWTGANTQVYARGMLVAFLFDLTLLDASRGKRSVTDILREVFRKHGPPIPAEDGNVAVLSILRGYRELVPVIERNILGSEDIDWARLLAAAGLEAETRDQHVRLRNVTKPSGRQRDLLDKLGYNSARKMAK